MASAIDVLKEYMVSLGFSVDKQSYDSATKAIDSAGESLAKFAGSTVKKFAEASVGVAGFFAAAIAGIAKFINGLGNAQIQYEMLARQMWTTQENAEAFSTTLKAMGRSLNDLYLSPTLMAQFQELNKQAFEMMPPEEYQKQMQFVQNISLQFTRMKLEGTYALQWIGYYFIKYMSGPLAQIYNYLNNLNNTIIQKMPYWTKVVAEVLSWFASLGVTTVEALKDIGQEFGKISDSIPKNIKLIGLALGALAIVMNQGPIGWIIDGFTILLLLLNDFFTYIHGGKAEFGSFWQKLIDFYNNLKDSGAIDAFKKNFESAMKTVSGWVDRIDKGIQGFFSNMNNLKTIAAIIAGITSAWATFKGVMAAVNTVIKLSDAAWIALDLAMDANPIGLIALAVGALVAGMIIVGNKSGIITDLLNDFGGLFQSIWNVISAVGGLITKIGDLKSTKAVLKWLGDFLEGTILVVLVGINGIIKDITASLNAIADVFQGKWGDAWKDIKGMFSGSSPSNQSYLYPSSQTNNTNNNQKSNVSMTNNFTITGSDPKATATAATNNLTTVMRNARGVIV